VTLLHISGSQDPSTARIYASGSQNPIFPILFCVYIPVDGGWSDWSAWSECSSSGCGRGVAVRHRTCTRPTPSVGARFCQGSAVSTRHCQRICSSDNGMDRGVNDEGKFKGTFVRHAVVTTTIRLPFDCNSTALRPFDKPRHDRAAALRPK